jgi:hypothetical protein
MRIPVGDRHRASHVSAGSVGPLLQRAGEAVGPDPECRDESVFTT